MKKKNVIIFLFLIVAVIVSGICIHRFDMSLFHNHNESNNIETNKVTVETESELHKKAGLFLEHEFIRVYEPYYDIESLKILNWEENGNEATFFFEMRYLYYNKNPDTVEYIREVKESDPEQYKILCEDYFKEKSANFEFKIVDNGESLELFSNISPKGVEWKPVKIDDYILK